MQRVFHCLVLLLLPALLGSCDANADTSGSASGKHGKDSSKSNSQAAKANDAKKIPLVMVEILAESYVEDRLPCTSHIEVFHEVAIPSQAPGQVTRVYFDIGKIVKKGDVLIRIDDREASLNLQKTKVQERDAEQKAEEAKLSLEEARGKLTQSKRDLAHAEVELQRLVDGLPLGLTVQKALELGQLDRDRAANSKELAEYSLKRAELGQRQAQTALESAQIQRKILERRMEDFTIRSPIDGIISERMVKGGEWISMQSPLCKVVDHKDLILQITRPQQQLGIIRPGQRVELEVDAWPDIKFEARIELLSPVIDRATGTFKARARIKDPKTQLRPGMFCKADIITRVSQRALMITKRGIFYDHDAPYAFVVREGKALRIDIIRGIETKDAIEALNKGEGANGAKPPATSFIVGDRVIVRSQDELRGGEAVRVSGDRQKEAVRVSGDGQKKGKASDSAEAGDAGSNKKSVSEKDPVKTEDKSSGTNKSSHGTELR